jgi:toxin YoeB
MMNKVFSDKAWEDYQYWVENDRKILRKINELLRDIERGGHSGIGKPEPLKYDLEGFWSRRITGEHRLVYSIEGDSILIAKCRKHYK